MEAMICFVIRKRAFVKWFRYYLQHDLLWSEIGNFVSGIADGDRTGLWASFLFQDLMDQECVRKMNTTRLLNELSDTFKLQYNMSFLEWIFEKCGDHQLVEKCQKFSSGYKINLECFQTNFIACKPFVSII